VSKLGFFLTELRRRKVFGVATAYLFVAWGVIEVSSTILQMAAGPAWVGKTILAVVATGFPIALVFAWFFDISMAGVVRTAALDADQRAHVVGARFGLSHLFAAGGVIATAGLVMGFAVWLRPTSSNEVTFAQITNFADAATAPTLSPDGKTLAFLKGRGFFGNSATPAQLYIKQLPDGQEVQLTNTRAGKATPTFSPDGSRIYFTSAEGNFEWSTYAVSVNGGHVTKVLANASGLSFIDSQSVLFAEIKKGTQMGLRRGTLNREIVHDVYWPNEDGMAHRAAPSPDRKWVLVVEMDGGVWQECRLIPVDGSSVGRRVGPPGSQCTYAAWSPDGKWMYFTTNAGGTFHLWRQRYPDGEPEQLTFGPTEEEGLAVAPDGRSLITSAGLRHNAIHLLDDSGERPVSEEEFAFSPVATRDGKKVHFLSRAGISRVAYNVGTLVSVGLDNGVREEILPGYRVVHFDISADDRLVVFASGNDDVDRRGVWVGSLDRSAAPRRVFGGDVERVFFDSASNIYFLHKTPTNRFVHRLRAPNYDVDELVTSTPVRYIHAVSPDGAWVVAVMPLPEGGGLQQVALSTRGKPARVICRFCGGGAGPARILAPGVSWTRDNRAMLVSAQFVAPAGAFGPDYTILVPLRPGTALPDLPEGGVSSANDYLKLPGARRIPKLNVLPGATPEQLFTYEPMTVRNLYRVHLPK
jgi:eukaryotic-like serine/threonine-protein kinase